MERRSRDEQKSQNAAIIRKKTLEYIAEHGNAPASAWLAEATGLAVKTIKRHRKRLALGSGEKNPFQILTPAVIESLYRRAVGYSRDEEKLLVVSGGPGCGSSVERHPVTKHYPPDPTAAKLFLQVVEGFTEKQKTEHSGTLGLAFNYHAPGSAANPLLPDAD